MYTVWFDTDEEQLEYCILHDATGNSEWRMLVDAPYWGVEFPPSSNMYDPRPCNTCELLETLDTFEEAVNYLKTLALLES